MLNRSEKAIMKVVYEKCQGVGNCLVTIDEIRQSLPAKKQIKNAEIEKILRSLELDNYFELVFSERKGQPILCINLNFKGQSFKREATQFKRAVINRLILASIGAVATFIIGRILVYIFS